MTDKELLAEQPKKLFKLSQLLEKKIIDLDDIAEIVPGIMHINSRKDLGMDYISKSGADMIGYSLEEIQSLGAKIFHKHQSNYTLEVVYPKLFQEIEKNDINHVIPFFQDWRYKKDEKAFFYFTSTKILNNEQLISISLFPDQIETLSNTINGLFGIERVFDTYFSKFRLLTKREKEILELLGKELTRKEISQRLFIDPKTVKKHCENIFKKLGTNKRTDLEKIALAFSTL